jgi:hypothetical protein
MKTGAAFHYGQASGALLFHLISKLYERTSLIITEWSSVFGMPR